MVYGDVVVSSWLSLEGLSLHDLDKLPVDQDTELCQVGSVGLSAGAFELYLMPQRYLSELRTGLGACCP